MSTLSDFYDELYDLIIRIDTSESQDDSKSTDYKIFKGKNQKKEVVRINNEKQLINISSYYISNVTGRLYRNKIIATHSKHIYLNSCDYFIDTSVTSKLDEDEYFNLSLLGALPEIEHINFAIKLQIYARENLKAFIILPKFINIEELRKIRCE